ncbi:MAG: DegV family protein, partial [Ligilactobacillus agilis]|nr:DegV family protein [Ligilactobacillus agilis]
NNGRINKTVAKLAQVLKINVLGWANEAGEIEQLGKARGAKKARHNLLALLEQHHFDGQHLVIDHADNLEGAKAFKDLVLAKYPTCQVEIGNCNALCSFYAEKGGLMIVCLVKE